MKVKNTSGKIVSVGETVILPGQTAEIVGFDKNAALDFLIKRKALAVATTPKGGRK